MTADFRIAAAQVASVRGDIAGNIRAHTAAIVAAAECGVSVLIFPELSLTGYEPDLASGLATTAEDARLAALLDLAGQHQIEIVAGLPLRGCTSKPYLGAVAFAADGTTRTYAKMHLGAGERAYFTPGDEPLAITAKGHTVGVAICADASQPTHPRAYVDAGATVYAAGVFLNAEWYTTDSPRLAGHAANCRVTVVMANHADSIGTYRSVGRSAAWAPDGTLLAQAAGTECCLVVATCNQGVWRGTVVEF